jgi:hypothetical protein
MRFEGFASLSKLKFFYGLFHQLELATSFFFFDKSEKIY